jgi:hypothetical protein
VQSESHTPGCFSQSAYAVIDAWQELLAAEKQSIEQVSALVHAHASRHVAYVAHPVVTADRLEAQFAIPHVSHSTLSGPGDAPPVHVSAVSEGEPPLELLHAGSNASRAREQERRKRRVLPWADRERSIPALYAQRSPSGTRSPSKLAGFERSPPAPLLETPPP